MRYGRRLVAAAALGALLLPATAATAQVHSSELPPLTRDTVFPRCSRADLLTAGFPDHMHAHRWPGWETPVGADGRPYGPGAYCRGRVLREDAAGLVIAPDHKQLGRFLLRHNPGYADCDMIPFLEQMEWAERYVADVLGLTVDGNLEIINPDSVDDYRRLTGYGTWRLFARDGDSAVLQPFPTLTARTLDLHAAVMLMTDWALAKCLPTPLPGWLHRGLVEYVAEDGPHLANYMFEFREKGSVLLSPAMVNALQSAGAHADDGQDREMHRRAGYSAFLMVWELVENQGGLEAMRDFLDRAASGNDLDQAAVAVYGLDLQGLAGLLDASKLGEPYGRPVGRHTPQIQP